MEYLDLLNHLLNDNVGGAQVIKGAFIIDDILVYLAITALILSVASTILSALMQPRPLPPIAASLSDFQVPTAEEGRPVPVIFGTVLIKGANVIWYGDLKKEEIPAPDRGGSGS